MMYVYIDAWSMEQIQDYREQVFYVRKYSNPLFHLLKNILTLNLFGLTLNDY